MKLKQYNQYKESEIDFIGKIPNEWRTPKLNLVSLFIMGQAPPSEFYNMEGVGKPFIKAGDFNKLYPKIIHYTTKPLIYGKEGDVFLCIVGATAGKVNLGVNGTISRSIGALRPLNLIDQKYLYYFLKYNYENLNNAAMGSAQGIINIDILSDIRICLPPREKQREIISFLDKKVSNLDNLIERDKKLIELLNERRIALINQVMTRGLDQQVKYKDSEIDWIGKIPSHWKINKIKNTSYVKGRIGWQGLTSEEYSDEGAYLVTGTDFRRGKVDWESCHHVSWERYKEDPYIHLRKNDLLITKDGTIGKIALIGNMPDKATLNSGIFLVRPLNNSYDTKFMYWLLNSLIFERFFDYIKTGATISHLYQDTFERFFFPIPPKKEQEEIVKYLDKATTQIDTAVKKIKKRMKLLEEYKKSLIYNLVTGKVNVTNK